MRKKGVSRIRRVAHIEKGDRKMRKLGVVAISFLPHPAF
jgi:hypothetical protein